MMTSEPPVMTGTLTEREELMTDNRPHRSGFTPRPIERLTNKRLPRSTTHLDCSHFIRSSTDEVTHGHLPVTYRLWLEAGKHPAPYPERPDPQYNSNVWRNFRQQYGFYTNSQGAKVGDMVAMMYPMNIPPPSRVGDYTYARFLQETPLIKDPRTRRTAIEKIKQDIYTFQQMRVKSDTRNPPLDKAGNILPPTNYRKYPPHPEPPLVQLSDAAPELPIEETRVDIFGKRVPKPKRAPFLWKLSYKQNNPAYEKVKQELLAKQEVNKHTHTLVMQSAN